MKEHIDFEIEHEVEIKTRYDAIVFFVLVMAFLGIGANWVLTHLLLKDSLTKIQADIAWLFLSVVFVAYFSYKIVGDMEPDEVKVVKHKVVMKEDNDIPEPAVGVEIYYSDPEKKVKRVRKK